MTYGEAILEAGRLLDSKAESTKTNYLTALLEFHDFPTRSAIVSKTADWRNKGMKPTSIHLKYSAIRWFMNHFDRCFDPHDKQDCFNYMSELKTEETTPSVATPEQVERLLTEGDQRTSLAISLMYYHGLRVSDVAGLRLSNFEHHNGALYINLKTQKTKKAMEIRVLPQVKKLYNAYINGDRSTTVKTWDGKYNDGGFLFVGQRGRLTKNAMQVSISKLCHSEGTPELHCHSFRHGCGTAYAKAGADVAVIKSVLGHKSIASSARYIHLDSNDIYEASQGVF